MADDIDLANALIDNEVSRALAKLRQSSAGETSETKYCMECGEDIPAPRRKLGFKFCVSCAEFAERKRSRFAE